MAFESLPTYVVGLIQRADNRFLVRRKAHATESHPWHFPLGKTGGDESPEAAMRRIAREELGMDVEVDVGQPPVVVELDGERVILRYFFCGIVKIDGGESAGGNGGSESMWVSRDELKVVDIEPFQREVVQWLVGK